MVKLKVKNLLRRIFDRSFFSEVRKKIFYSQIEQSNSENLSNTAIVFLTNSNKQSVKNKYEKIKEEMKSVNVFKIVTSKELFEESYDTILYEHDYCEKLNYTPFDKEKIIPGCTYFALLYFKTIYPKYNYYWLIEDDVWYNGNWSNFFLIFENKKFDFISTYFTTYKDTPNWYWWNSLITEKLISNKSKIRTFYPICRFSRKALDCLDMRLKMGDYGHGEVLVPTLLHIHGMSFYDLVDTEQRVMIPSTDRAVGDHNNGSFRYRPIISKEEIKGEYLFHPVKDDIDIL